MDSNEYTNLDEFPKARSVRVFIDERYDEPILVLYNDKEEILASFAASFELVSILNRWYETGSFVDHVNH
jgi:hypothetical protein